MTTNMPRTSALRSDALQQLRRQHVSLDKLFFAFHLLCERDDTEREKLAIVERIHLELAVHLQLVSDVVHPALQQLGEGDAALIEEARAAHASVREMVALIVSQPLDDTERDARVEALGEFVARQLIHERSLLFPRLRNADLNLKGLGHQLAERREALLAEYGRLLQGDSVSEDEAADPVGQPAPPER